MRWRSLSAVYLFPPPIVRVRRSAHDPHRIGGEFGQELPTGTARRNRFGAAIHDGQHPKIPLPAGHSRRDRRHFGAECQAVGGVLHVRTKKYSAPGAQEGGAHLKFRVGSVSVAHGSACLGKQRVCVGNLVGGGFRWKFELGKIGGHRKRISWVRRLSTPAEAGALDG